MAVLHRLIGGSPVSAIIVGKWNRFQQSKIHPKSTSYNPSTRVVEWRAHSSSWILAIGERAASGLSNLMGAEESC